MMQKQLRKIEASEILKQKHSESPLLHPQVKNDNMKESYKEHFGTDILFLC